LPPPCGRGERQSPGVSGRHQSGSWAPTRRPAPGPLTARQRLFVEYYLGQAHFNAAGAARLAGYGGRSETALRVTASRLLASRLLAHPKIAALVRAPGSMGDAQVAAEEVLGRISAVLRAEVRDLLPARDPLRHRLTADLTPAIPAIRRDRHGALAIELVDRIRAAELLLRVQGRLGDRRHRTFEEILEASWREPTQGASDGPGALAMAARPLVAIADIRPARSGGTVRGEAPFGARPGGAFGAMAA
jgi:phage terminase small subunit